MPETNPAPQYQALSLRLRLPKMLGANGFDALSRESLDLTT